MRILEWFSAGNFKDMETKFDSVNQALKARVESQRASKDF